MRTQRFNNEDLRVESGNRTSYLQFDLSQVQGSVQNATLELTVGSDAGEGPVMVYAGTHSNWTETNLSTSNAPGLGAELSQKDEVFAVGSTYPWDVSAAPWGSSKASFIVEMGPGNDVSFASKENGMYQVPRLRVKTSTITSTQVVNKVEGLGVYPNPSVDGVFFLSEPQEFEVYSLAGERLLSGKGTEVRLTELPGGNYILQTSGRRVLLAK